ncbi:MAG TPA: FG-GAP-like repeat-containing protein, partial [Paludibacter sp.]|nr:FG-GAP-like repeat-containing protein [Paludibacter sp.]
MQTRYKHIILFAALCLWAMAGRAQTTPQVKENWELNTSESGSPKSYVARDYVSLKPGFRYTAGTGASFNAKVDPGLLFPPTANTYAKPDGTITTDPAQGGVVGAIPGSLGVSPSGSATYTIPIECPPGINGMQPGISLVYSSQGGNGIAGWGWNLSGMSAIGRTGFNLYNDNKIGSPQLTNDDNLTLDGQRLILVSGTNLTDGAKYRTEIEIYSDITYRSINGYTCFEVRTKEGVTMEFGSTADSYIEAQGSSIPLTWLLAKVTDANGNYMTYSYGEDNATGEFWLDKIKYTCNDAAGITTGANEIHFNYTTGRTDSQTSYVAGKKIGQSLLLQSVVTKTNSVTQREYTFSYSIADGFYNKLTSINEKGNDGTKYNPTVIDWNKLGSTTTPEFGYTTSNTGVGSLMNFTMDKTMIFVDLNNDGFVDMIRPTMVMLYSWDYSGWEIYYSTLTTNGRNFVLNQKEDWTEEWKYNRGINPFTGQYQLLPADLNGDGRPDIIEIRQTTSESPQISYCNIDVLLNVNGELVRQNINFSVSGTTNEKFIFEAGDFNGDGETELAAKTYSGGSQIKVYSFDLAASTLTLLGTTSDVSGDLSKSRTTDVNGNGKPEIFTQAGKFIEYDNNSNTFAEIAFAHNLIPTVADLEFGDFNGDGMTDVLQYLSGMNPKWTILMSTGSGFETVSCPLTRTKTTQPQENDPQDFYWVKDFNGDGKADILERAVGSNDVTIYYYNGSSFISHTHTIAGANGFVNDRSLPYYDIDGDGKSDIVNTTATSFSVISFTTPETERSVSAITNGMGVKSTIAYKLLNDNSVYSNGTTVPTTPVVKLCVPMQVVSQTVSGVGNLLETTNYSYKGLRMHLKGKGFLGFEEFTQDNVTQNKKSVSQFGYNETYFNSFPTNQTTSTSAGQAISTTTFINNVIPLDGKRIFPYTASQTSTDNLSGLSSTSTTSRFDDSGNPLTITVTKGDVSETQRMHYIQKGSWCKNKMDTLTVINTLGSETIARKTLYYYDDKGNLIKDIADPADQNSVTNEYKNYDSFGHALLATATSNGITRSTSSTYTISGRFLQSKTNVLGETTTYNWDETKGQLDSESNRFGTTSYSYNGFGSLVETRLPDGIRKAQVLQWAAPDNVIGARYYAYAETSGSTPVTIWYDALGREIQKDSYGLNAKKISVTTEYYSNNQVYRISDPYFEPDAATKVWAKTYTYDMYGRPSTLVTLMGTNSTAYNGKTTTVTTPEGTTETTVNDAGQTFISKVNGKKVTYAYYASGLIKTTTPEGSQAIAMEYDLQGKRTKLTDPDAGIVETKYNGFGEVTEEKQKIHNVTTYITTTNNYAATGLLQSIVRNGETTTYTYDTNNRISTIEIAGKNKQTFTYDAFDRVTNVKEEIGSRVYNTAKEYDVLGRVKKEIYPSGFYTLNSYDGYGNLMEVRDNAGRSIWRANSENARGQLISINKGTKETTFGFDSRGFPTSIVASGVEDMSYSFDSKGNLSYRTDNLTNQSEQFAYDGLNRLTNWNVYQNGVLAKQSGHTYDAATGN